MPCSGSMGWASTWLDILEGDGATRFVIVRIEDLVLPDPQPDPRRGDGSSVSSLSVVQCCFCGVWAFTGPVLQKDYKGVVEEIEDKVDGQGEEQGA